MKRPNSAETAIFNPRIFAAFLLCLLGLSLGFVSIAGTPSSDTLTPSHTTVTYTGGPFQFDNPTTPVGKTPPVCTPATPCDQFALTVTIPPGDNTNYRVTVNIAWANGAANDYDLFIYQPDITGTQTAQSASSSDPEKTSFAVPSGPGTTNYTVIVVPYATDHLTPFTGTITLAPAPPPPAPPTGPPPAPGDAIFDNFTPDNGLGGDWGEPSIGVDLQSEKNGNGGTIMSYGGFSTYALRLTFNDCTSPARAIFEATPLLTAALPRALGDPILFTVHNPAGTPDRTLVSQLNGTKLPNIDYTDNDGSSYTPSQGSGVNSGYDHQTIGAGPYPAGVLNPGLYPNAVYYCSQDDADANCARSDNGGQTFGPAIPMYNASQCVGLHGHVKVAPDGTVYVPNRGCGGLGLAGPTYQALLVSTNGGVNWTLQPLTDSKHGANDPSVGIGQNNIGKPGTNLQGTNTVYFGWADGDKTPHVAVSHDRGATWEHNTDVGTAFALQNVAFPTVTAGDDNRAAFTFLGTNEPGGGTSQDTSFQGVWHLFVATTYDGGVTWKTVDATPNDPVQRGVICLAGTLCATGTRNLLDFIDASVDKEGRINIVYADGCVGGCVGGSANSGTSISTFARQSGGKSLYSAYDSLFAPAAPTVPKQPLATANLINGTTAQLTWSTPSDGGSPITGYKVYRGSDSSPANLIVTLGPTIHTYNDTAASATSFYYVTATNTIGESAQCDKVFPTTSAVLLNPCTLPGVTVVVDPTGDQTGKPLNSDLDIQSISIAEPFVGAGVNELVFTMKVADLTTVPPNHQWRIIWTPAVAPSATADRYYVGMTSDGAGAVSYDYGTVTSNGNVPVSSGPADSGSYSPDGTIRITLSNSKVGNPQAGATLATLSGRNFAGTGLATLTKTSATDSTADSSYLLVGNASCQSVQLGKLSSRLTHTGAGTFDIDLTGGNGIECRRGSGNGSSYKMVFKFANPIASITGATASSNGGSPTVSSTEQGTDPNEFIVNLSGVPNGSNTTVTLTGVVDTQGNSAASVQGILPVLLGDVNQTRLVDGNDVSEVQGKTRQTIDTSNFKMDVDTSGLIDGNDVSMTQGQTRSALTPASGQAPAQTPAKIRKSLSRQSKAPILRRGNQ